MPALTAPRDMLRLAGAAVIMLWGSVASGHAQSAQPSASSQQHVHEAPQTGGEHAGHDVSSHDGHDMGSMAREGSGTSWLPDSSPMYAIHRQKGPWMLMAHENGFLQFLHESGNRGDDQTGSINWVMGMAARNAGPGHIGFRGMFSVEPWTIRGCGYPDLLASGEECHGEKIHDRQHPHDVPMEISAEYDAPLAGTVRWQVYGGPAGEPALGPVAYPHRVSAMANPLAPITHHWLDSTHLSFGVVTGGLYGKRWKAETSVFNGREPDAHRTDVDFGALDSASGRLWVLPTANLALQVSAGRLTEAEEGDGDGPRVDVTRTTASATYHTSFRDDDIWATTLAWGRNAETGHATNALLIETNLTVEDRDTWFGRFEIAGKTAGDLDAPRSLVHDVEGNQMFTVGKLQGGYTRYLKAWRGFEPGFGGTLSAGIAPKSLEAVYGSRVNAGLGVFLTLRPSRMEAQHTAKAAPSTEADHARVHPPEPAARPAGAGAPRQPAAAPAEPRLPVIAAERVIDPACAATIDLLNAPRATYQGKVYYFCSTADRDAFVKDPDGYLARRAK